MTKLKLETTENKELREGSVNPATPSLSDPHFRVKNLHKTDDLILEGPKASFYLLREKGLFRPIQSLPNLASVCDDETTKSYMA